ncbi:hypothetical protein VSR34_09665 [Paraburkholderia sp. JHI2823]|uniref:hypothetical protein n=1 Tax=Paraburkholderia sp. JHI2823 TaxID=3112960 RepID=UPI0031746E6F
MMITAPCCIANGCPAPASYHGGGGWVCAAHRDAPAEKWVAVTAWNCAHEWAYTAAAFAEWISSVEWRDLADRIGARVVQRGYPTWAPRVVRIEQSAFDRVTGAATVTVRERDEREHGHFWAYRLRRELLAECLRLPARQRRCRGWRADDRAKHAANGRLARENRHCGPRTMRRAPMARQSCRSHWRADFGVGRSIRTTR